MFFFYLQSFLLPLEGMRNCSCLSGLFFLSLIKKFSYLSLSTSCHMRAILSPGAYLEFFPEVNLGAVSHKWLHH